MRGYLHLDRCALINTARLTANTHKVRGRVCNYVFVIGVFHCYIVIVT